MRAVHGRISSLVTPKEASPSAQHPHHKANKTLSHGPHGHAKPLVKSRHAVPVAAHASESNVTAVVVAKAAALETMYEETLASAPAVEESLDADMALVTGGTELVRGGVEQDEMPDHLLDFQNMMDGEDLATGGPVQGDSLPESGESATLLSKSASDLPTGEAKKS